MAKYQVFLSSTYRDLKEERDLVIRAILEMGHIPVGMEMFSAADEEQWSIIRKQIEQSDYYVVIVAHRYGSCDATGRSYTEKEYDFAVSIGVPVLGLVIDETVSWPREKSDSDNEMLSRLVDFKMKVQGKPVSFWRNGEDLYGKCTIALIKAFNAYPREGWVRASQVQDAAASKELTRLSAENAELRVRVAEHERVTAESVRFAKTIEVLRGNKTSVSVWKKTGSGWESSRDLTLYQVFETLAPELQVDCGIDEIARHMAGFAGLKRVDQRPNWPTPRNYVKATLADFGALDCVVPSPRKKPVTDKNEYWTLSQFGMKLLGYMRRRRLEKVESLSVLPQAEGDATSEDKDV